jgi:serine/threonine protein kinase/tetratricopeptide (TPR) repeat protein
LTPHQLRFGPYTTLSRIGEGGMGVVYLARREGTQEDVALKTVRLARRSNLAGIRAEVRALASLRHPGIVKVRDFGIEGGAPWYAMELLHGQNLGAFVTKMWFEAIGHDANSVATVSDIESQIGVSELAVAAPRPAVQLVPRNARLPAVAAGKLPDFMRITAEVCTALSYLHRNGLLHGDLKPSNIFICTDGRVVLLDFGLVSQSRGSIGREVLESAGAIRGTLPYLAPERLRGDFADARADLFGIGALLYEALTGQLPFHGSSASEILTAQQAGLAALPSHLVAEVPPELDRLVKALLAFSPQDRIGHAEDVVAVLGSLGLASTAPAGESPKATYLYRPPLAGRARVVDRLLERLSATKAGKGGIVLLTGESGVGKTALMAELGRRATQQHVTVVNGECIPIAAAGGSAAEIKEAPLHPFRGLLQDVADRCAEWPAETVDSLLAPRGKLLARYEPALGTVPGAERFAELVELPADAALQRLLRELGVLLEALPAVTGPLVLLIDDLQWADELSIRFLQALKGDFFLKNPVLIVATVRADEMNTELRALAATEVVESVSVERLDEAAVEEMIGGMLSMGKPPLSLVKVLARHSEGNPFFVAEYLRLAVEERVVVRRDGRWKIAAGDEAANVFEDLALPVSIRDLVERRLGGLSADARTAIDIAAVIGRTFEVSLLAEAAGLAEDEALRRLREPMALNIVDDVGAGMLRFAHDKLRETAYSALSADRKVVLHGSVARCIETRCQGDRLALTEHAPELVHHFKLAQDSAAALGYLELAGEAALRKSAHNEAATFLEDAIATAERAKIAVAFERRARWEKMIGDAYLALGQHDVSLKHFEVALAALGAALPKDSMVGAHLLGALGTQVAHRFRLRTLPTGAHAQSAKLLEMAHIHDRLLQIYFYRGSALPRMLHAMASSMNLAERAGPSPYLALGYVNTGATAGIIPLRGLADRYFGLARAAVERHPNEEIETFVDLLEAHYRFGCGDFARAQSLLTSAMAISERLGFLRRWEEVAGLYRSTLVAQGRFDEARPLNNRVLASAQRGDRQVQCWELTGRAHIELATGDAGSALRDASLAAELAAGQQRQERLRANGALAAARLRCGDLEGARKAADISAAEIDAGPPLGPYWFDPFCDVIDVRFAVWDGGDVREAPTTARHAVKALEKLGGVFPVGAARVQLYVGHLQRRLGDLTRARAAWRRGIELAEPLGLRYDLALNEAALGASLERAHPERRTRLERACQLLRDMGARHALGTAEAVMAEA